LEAIPIKIIDNVEIMHSDVFDFLASIFRLNCNEKFLRNDVAKSKKIKFNEDIINWVKNTREKIPEEIYKKIRMFFDWETFYGMCVYKVVIENKTEDIPTFLDNVKKMTSSKILSYFISTGYNLEEYEKQAIQITEKLITDEKEAIDFINNKICIPSDKKWELLQFFINPDNMKNEFLQLLDWYYKNIYIDMPKFINTKLEKYEKLIIKNIKRYGKEYVKILTKGDYDKFQQNVFGISYFYEAASLSSYMAGENTSYYLIGYKYQDCFLEDKHSILSNVQMFKSIGDETRLNIIKLLNERPYYGKEIAQKLKLSNSTISYHLNALTYNKFIKESKVENRIYYTFNSENMKQIICDAIDKMLE
jgi:DNA-binding transcriptional ArsR family regulator